MQSRFDGRSGNVNSAGDAAASEDSNTAAGASKARASARKLLLTLLAVAMAVSMSPTAPQQQAFAAEAGTPSDTQDGTVELPTEWKTLGTCEWQVDASGCLTIRPTNGSEGELDEWVMNGTSFPWIMFDQNTWFTDNTLASAITSARFEGTVKAPVNAYKMFGGMPNLKTVDLTGLDTSNTTSMLYMFNTDSSLETVKGLSSLDTSKVTDMRYMFEECDSLKTVSLAGWDTSSAKLMHGMFRSCDLLTSVDLSGLDVSKVTSMYAMFESCGSLKSAALPSGKASSLQDMSDMFQHCESLENLSFGNFETPKAEDFSEMFSDCQNLKTLDISSLDTSSATNMDYMFYYCVSLHTIKVGSKFSLKGAGNTVIGSFPTDRVWVSSADGKSYLGAEIPDNVAATYTSGAAPTSRFERVLEFCDARTWVNWDDSWFETTSSEYNHDLATTAAVLASAAYDENQIRDAFSADKLGFDDRDITTYYPKEKDYYSNYGQVAYALGTRITADGTPIVAVVVRGTPGNGEWLSNLNIADTAMAKNHEGFEQAATQVLGALSTYVVDNDIDMSQARFVVTGHSRGAAVSNLVAAKMDDGQFAGDKHDELSSDRVYAFTYATPASTKDSSYGAAKYNNIFNILNPEDLIPMVPMSQWGFHRYGRDMVLPSKSNTKLSTYNSMYAEMNSYFCQYYGSDYQNYTTGVLGPYSICASLFQLAPTVNAYYRNDWRGTKSPRQIFGSIVKLAIMKKGGFADYADVAAALVNPKWNSVIFGICGEGVITGVFGVKDGIRHGHTQETYVAWMKSVQTDSIGEVPNIFRGAYVKFKAACPVDVKVYDSSNTLVASIENDVVDESLLESGLPAMVDEDGNKMIDIPSDEGYSIEVTATADGEMDLTVEDSTGVVGDASSLKTYQGVSLEKGDTFTMADPGSYSSDELVLTDESTLTEAEAGNIATQDACTYRSVSVTSSGDGTAWGGGAVLEGGKAYVHAQPSGGRADGQPSEGSADAQSSEGSGFLGWYIGEELVSSDLDYEFRIWDDVQIEARFESAPASMVRLAGDTRYETSAMLSGRAYPDDGSCTTVVIARGDNFADALSAAGLAGVVNGQVLLTQTWGLSDEVAAEISRLGAAKAYIVGGTSAVSDEAMSQVSALVGGNVERVAGNSRYSTALEVYSAMQKAASDDGFAIGNVAIVAQGMKAADALSASPISYALGAPIFLVDPAQGASDETLAALRSGGFDTVLVMGGEAAVPRTVDDALAGYADVVRIAGSDRFDTSKKAAEWALSNGMTLERPVVASGNDANFPDALSASALAGHSMSPLLLVADSELGYACVDGLLAERSGHVDTVYVAGGTAAVPEAVYEAVERALGIG